MPGFCARPKQVRVLQPGTVLGTTTQTVGDSSASAAATVISDANPGNAFLRIGIAGSAPIGRGPGGLLAPNPIYRVIGPYIPTVAGISADIALARQHDVMLVWDFAGGRAAWAPGTVYDKTLWRAKADRFSGNPDVQLFLAERRGWLMICDEPNRVDDFGSPSSISPRDINEMALFLKVRYNNALNYFRVGSGALANGWSNTAGLAGPPTAYTSEITGKTESGYSGADYAFAQFAWSNTKESCAAFFLRERGVLAGLNLGMIPGFNYWDGGNWQATSDGIPVCWDYQYPSTAQGVLVGTRGDSIYPDGTPLVCGHPDIGTTGATRFLVPSPALMRSAAVAAALDLKAPWFSGFTYADPGASIIKPWQVTHQSRADTVLALQDMIASGFTRTSWDGLRPIKVVSLA